jgi:hypothetical protein
VTATKKYSHVELKQNVEIRIKPLTSYHKALKYSIQSYALGGGDDVC